MISPLRTVILGTGGNSVEILDTINEINAAHKSPRYECVAFLDDDQSTWGTVIHGVKVHGPLSCAGEIPDAWFVNGIGSPATFWKKDTILARAGIAPEKYLTLIHPSASVSRLARLGHGVVIFQKVTITNNVRIGNHVIILPNAVISHDDVIGDHTCIAGGVRISGSVKIGRLCYLGTNSTLLQNITVGDHCLIGPGSVVLADVPDNSVIEGSPAKYVRQTFPLNGELDG